MRNISKIALALALLGTSATASAAYPTYWSRHDYGNYSSYSGTRNGGWALGGEILNHYVYWGSIFDCPLGVTSCAQWHSEQTSYGWTWGWSISIKVSILPNIMDYTYMGQYSETRTRTLTDTYIVTLKPGQKSQYAEYMPRKYGNNTLWGARVKTGNTSRSCTAIGPLGTCWGSWYTNYEYYDDPWVTAAYETGWKNIQDQPTRTFWMLKK